MCKIAILTCETGVTSNADIRCFLVLCNQEVKHALFALREPSRDIVNAKTRVVEVIAALLHRSPTASRARITVTIRRGKTERCGQGRPETKRASSSALQK